MFPRPEATSGFPRWGFLGWLLLYVEDTLGRLPMLLLGPVLGAVVGTAVAVSELGTVTIGGKLVVAPAAMLCLTWSNKPADRQAIQKGEDIPKRLRIRYAMTAHMNLFIPKFKGAEDGSFFCKAAEASSRVDETTTLPGVEHAGLFRVQAKRYGSGELERVIALARPTA